MSESAPEWRTAILLVDDDPAVREALACGLADRYTIHTAATGEEACAILRTCPVAGIILDAMLGEEHGLDLVDRFRGLSHAPILLLTGHSTEELAIRAVRAQVREYLKKPVGLHDLHGALLRLLADLSLPPDPMTHVQIHLAEQAAGTCAPRELAGHIGLSGRQLRRRFRATHERTLRRTLADLRLRQAAGLLCTTELGIEEVAWRVRYASAAWFATIFKRAYGLTPSQFRARHRTPRDPGANAGSHAAG